MSEPIHDEAVCTKCYEPLLRGTTIVFTIYEEGHCLVWHEGCAPDDKLDEQKFRVQA